MVGEVTDPEKYYPLMSVLAHPSKTETTSLVAMEAMASGVPIVAPKVGRFKEFIGRSKGGILIEKTTKEELAHALGLILSDDKLRKTMSRNAQQYAKDNFDISISARKISQALKSVL